MDSIEGRDCNNLYECFYYCTCAMIYVVSVIKKWNKLDIKKLLKLILIKTILSFLYILLSLKNLIKISSLYCLLFYELLNLFLFNKLLNSHHKSFQSQVLFFHY